jgi:hypothetical protein
MLSREQQRHKVRSAAAVGRCYGTDGEVALRKRVTVLTFFKSRKIPWAGEGETRNTRGR